ncbi:TPA: hypothetical protein ACKP2Y_001272 [Pseudomonas putida]|jgi:3-methyladenine DNA glycosylase AlkC|uniref:hypothetical protein n=1 Tax=Pseudomonas sp. BEA3.1 TaxID=3083251 RepID=UPI001104F0E7|nr:hypothetical protein [Pseudomonas sp. BEA3.1]MDW2775820.1 hypothetical protein [Pseudomonas sp. BEA3.1]TFW39357.1 hypothetical protein E4195_03795 [Pseudomonas putida]
MTTSGRGHFARIRAGTNQEIVAPLLRYSSKSNGLIESLARICKSSSLALAVFLQVLLHHFDQLQPALKSAQEGKALPACNQQKQ